MRMQKTCWFVLVAATYGFACSAVSPADVLDAAVAVSALRRFEEGDAALEKAPAAGAFSDEAIRGLAREAPTLLLPQIVEHYRSLVAAVLTPDSTVSTSTSPLSADDVATAKASADTLFGPVSPAPEQLHLGFGDNAGPAGTNVSIMWVTSEATSTGMACVSCPGASASDAVAADCVTATSYTYNPISVLPWHGMIHSAFVALPPGARCEYRVGPTPAESPNRTLWSANTTFTVPDTESADRPLFVALGGDMGTIQLVGYKVAAQMHAFDQTSPVDAFWHLGDIAYSTLDPPKLNFEFFWDMYMRQEQSLLNHVPVLATYGNHDFSGGDSAAFINRFHNPRDRGGNANFYFAKRQGPVMYVSMCTERSLNPTECEYAPGSKQYLWLEATLAGVNRSETPWVVLGGHRPMYSSDKSTDSGPLQKYIEPLLTRYNVDLEVAGHMHCTELTTPVTNGVTNSSGVSKVGPSSWVFASPGAPVHMTLGTLGAVIIEAFEDPAPAWSLYRQGSLFSDAYGFATLNATRSELAVRFLKESDGSTMWDVRITK